jgi:hypothetical protein
MIVEDIIKPDGSPGKHYIAEPGEHLVLTGPVSGIMTLADGTQVNVTPEIVALRSPDDVAELSHLIGMQHVENGHPYDIETIVDAQTGDTHVVQRPFVYVAPDGTETVGVGHAEGEHPVEQANTAYQAAADAAATAPATPDASTTPDAPAPTNTPEV